MIASSILLLLMVPRETKKVRITGVLFFVSSACLIVATILFLINANFFGGTIPMIDAGTMRLLSGGSLIVASVFLWRSSEQKIKRASAMFMIFLSTSFIAYALLLEFNLLSRLVNTEFFVSLHLEFNINYIFLGLRYASATLFVITGCSFMFWQTSSERSLD
jgi:hypothetical protein